MAEDGRLTLNEQKRRKWTEEEDVMLLQQVAADLPFAVRLGKSKAWQLLADTLMSCQEFDRNVDGKRAQQRFTTLVEEHRAYNANSATQSGVDEEHSEKHILLDDILAQIDDINQQNVDKSNKIKEDAAKAELGGAIVREMAMQSLGKRPVPRDKDVDTRENRRASLAGAIVEDGKRVAEIREKKLAFKKQKLDEDANQRALDRYERAREREENARQQELDRADRKEERAHQLAMAELENRKWDQVLKALLDKK